MRSKLVKLALGCTLAAAFAVPALSCEFYKQSVKNDQTVVQSQSQPSTSDSDQTAQSQPTENSGSN